MNNFLLIIFGFAALFMVAAVLLMIFFKPKKTGLRRDEFQKYWTKIQNMVNSGNLSDAKQAVMEADKLLDRILRTKVSGNDLGGRLKNAQKLFGNREVYQQLWEAHKLRNKLAHEVDFEVNIGVCNQVIQKFRRGFKDLGY